MSEFRRRLMYKKPYKKRLNAIISSNGQFIDTGIFITGDMELEFTVRFVEEETAGWCICGAYSDNLQNCVRLLLSERGVFWNQFGNKLNNPLWEIENNNYHKINLSKKGCIVDGKTISDYVNTSRLTTSLHSLVLFARVYGEGTFEVFRKVAIGELVIKKNDVEIQHLISVMDNNNTPCMYDLVSKKYFYDKRGTNIDFNYE